MNPSHSLRLSTPRSSWLTCHRWAIAWGWSLGLAGLGLVAIPAAGVAQSASMSAAKTLLQRTDTIANDRDVTRLQEIYSPDFTSDDGITYEDLEKSLASLWQLYPDLTYQTRLEGVTQSGNDVVLETVTTLTGNRDWLGDTAQLNGEIKSRQTFRGDKLIRQEILSETMTLTSGKQPPAVQVRLPKTVNPGETYDFDIILEEPVEDDLMAGSAFAQEITPENYLQPTQVKLELLQAGGLFKRAIAGDDPQWLSALLISPDGMILITQRLAIAK